MVKKLKYSIKDLNCPEFKNVDNSRYSEMKVCIVDDEDFKAGILHSVGFKNVIVRKEFGDVDDYESFDVILVDVTNVARLQFNSREGVGAAEELQERYPSKIVALYTARDVDEIRKKLEKFNDMDIISKVDEKYIKDFLKQSFLDLYSPYYACLRLEKMLNREKELTYLEKATIEHGFVAGFINNKLDYLNSKDFRAFKDGLEITTNIISLVASMLQIAMFFRQ